MKKILVLIPLTEEGRQKMKQQYPEGEFCFVPVSEGGIVSDEMIRESHVILGNLPPERLKCAEHLEWLQLNSSGADVYTRKGVLPENCLLTNCTGSYGLALSEHMLALTFAMKKKLDLYLRNREHHLWKDEGRVTAIEGSVTLVLGYGDIGENYGRRMALLGSRVYGIRRTKSECPPGLAGMGTFDQLEEWLPLADTVAMALPNSPETRQIMNAKTLAMMKPGSLLVNVGRGSSIDYDALLEALKNGPLGMAAVDVTDPEPLPPEHPLWECERFFVTPHIAGEYHLQETLDRITDTFTENLGRFRRNEELLHPVDFSTGYAVRTIR